MGPRTAEGKAISSLNAYKGGTRRVLREIACQLRALSDATLQADCLAASFSHGCKPKKNRKK